MIYLQVRQLQLHPRNMRTHLHDQRALEGLLPSDLPAVDISCKDEEREGKGVGGGSSWVMGSKSFSACMQAYLQREQFNLIRLFTTKTKG